jgi:hypothetical protein
LVAALENFFEQSFAQQILLLDECESAADSDDIARLEALLESPSLDESLRQSIADTLLSLLRVHTGQILKGLEASGPTRRICIQVAGEKALTSASGQLGSLAEGDGSVSDKERIAAYSALTKIATEDAGAVLTRGLSSDEPLIAAICSQHHDRKGN